MTLANDIDISDPSAEGTLNELASIKVFIIKIRRLVEGYIIKKYILNKRRYIFSKEYPFIISAINNLAFTLED
jgi:hypothetical protein